MVRDKKPFFCRLLSPTLLLLITLAFSGLFSPSHSLWAAPLSPEEISQLADTLRNSPKEVKESFQAALGTVPQKPMDLRLIGTALAVCLVIILLYLTFAAYSRRAIFQFAEDKDAIAEKAMSQTLGLPHGSIRGLLATIVAVAFFLAIFHYGDTKDMPEVLKIIVSLVFGFYFGKSTDQTKNVMEAMMGKSSQKAVRRKEASLLLAEARGAGADEASEEEFKEAMDNFQKGDQAKSPSEAIHFYGEAVNRAEEAKKRTAEKKREEFDQRSQETEKRIDELIALQIDHRAVRDLCDAAEKQARRGIFSDAVQTLAQVKSLVDVLLKEFDEVREIYENRLSEDQKKVLKDARENLDSASSLGVKGDQLIGSVMGIVGALKEKEGGAGLMNLFKKRVAGEDFEPAEVKEIFETLKKGGKEKKIWDLVDGAVNFAGGDIPSVVRDPLKKNIEKVVTGEEGTLDNFFREELADKGVDFDTFKKIAGKIRKKLVDSALEPAIKAGISPIDFDSYKKAMKEAQHDSDGKGALATISKVIDVGETLLSYVPGGGALKAAVTLGKGLYRVFGK